MAVRALLFALLAFAGPAPALAPAADPAWVGFNDISSVAGRTPFGTAAGAAAAAGSTSTRVIVDWSWLEHAPGEYTWGILDGVYRADLARGIRPLFGITGAPRWAWPKGAVCAGEHCAYPPAPSRERAYAALLREMTRRYPEMVGIQVGNEPNLAWAWTGGVNPARYTRLLKVAYAAVKSVDPDMPVIAAGLAPVMTETRTPQTYGLRAFLEGMYANGAKGHMDGIAVHPYPYGIDLFESFRALAAVKDVAAAHDDDVPVWVTELGISTADFAAENQATVLAALADELRADRDVRGIYVHSLYSDPVNPIARERGFGVIAAGGAPKPAYCAIALTFGGSASCAFSAASRAQEARWHAQALLAAAADAARRIRGSDGSYRDVTSARLHRKDARIAARPAAGRLAPSLTADPSQIGVYPLGRDELVLCNRSAGGRSYCYGTRFGRRWEWRSGNGSVFQTAGALLNGPAARAHGRRMPPTPVR